MMLDSGTLGEVDEKPLFIRVSPEFKAKVDAWAKRHRRSVTQQVLMVLEREIEAEEVERGPLLNDPQQH